MLVIAVPGQGAQTPGFLAPWLELPGAAERLARWSEFAQIDLIRMGTTANIDEITDTAVTQPLLVAVALLVGEHLPMPHIAAGHSVGELSAGVLAGVLAPDDAVRLASVRGRAMADATRVVPTGMMAVLGGDESTVLAAIAEQGLTAANVNAKGQVVAAGMVSQLESFAASAPPGTRLSRLRVAGAFHTAHMASAVGTLEATASGIKTSDPATVLLSNRDGGVVTSGQDWLARIVAQVAAPVRWDLCLETILNLGATMFVELPPAGTLSGLARRALPGIERIPLKSPDDFDVALRRINEVVDVG